MDERQNLNAGNAAQAALGLTTLGVVIYVCIVYFTTGTVGNFPLAVMIGGGTLFYLMNRTGRKANPPQSWWGIGNDLPTEPEQRRVRIRSYVLDTSLFVAGTTLIVAGALALGGEDLSLDPLANWIGLDGAPLVAAFLSVEAVSLWLISFALKYVAGESASAMVERQMAADD